MYPVPWTGRPALLGGGGKGEQSNRRAPGRRGGAPVEVRAESGGAALVGVMAFRKGAEAISGALWGCGSGRGVG